jgi:hypothetical protein
MKVESSWKIYAPGRRSVIVEELTVRSLRRDGTLCEVGECPEKAAMREHGLFVCKAHRIDVPTPRRRQRAMA